LDRRFVPLAITLLLAMVAAQFASMRGESQANDESFHLLNGYRYLKTGTLSLGNEHPPLAGMIAAFPLLFLELRLPAPHLDAGEGAQRAREQEFLYANRYPAGTILLWARSATLLWSLTLGLLVAWWTRRRFGPVPALAALSLLAFDPGFLAHGHYIGNDAPVALCIFAAALSWNAFLANGRLSRALACGALTGIAISTKYSALLLFPIYVLLYLVHWWQRPAGWRHSFAHLIKNMFVVGGIMFAVVYAIFGFETRPLVPSDMMGHPEPLSAKLRKRPELLGPLAPLVLSRPERLQLIETLLQRTPVPAPSFFRGLYLVSHHGAAGHPTYLLGQYSATGWWYYFPVVMAVKAPTGLALLFFLSVTISVRAILRGGLLAAVDLLKRLSPDWYVLTVPPLFYLLAGVVIHINIGIRHILPVYPFLFIWIAAALFSKSRTTAPLWLPRVASVCLILAMAESILAFPYYTGFFNAPSGGMRMGGRYVVDSNLDWGQDLIHLKTYLAGRHVSKVCLSYFGAAPPAYFGIVAADVPASLQEARRSACVVVMSNTQFAFDGGGARRYQWLNSLAPTDFAGSSFRIYDLAGAALPYGF
jgi:hypothetical protein